MAEQLLVRFRGIVAHIDLPKERDDTGLKKRAVLVRHQDGNGPIEAHVPYVSFLIDDVETISEGLTVLSYSRPGVDGRFGRIELQEGTEIRLRGTVPGYVTEEIGYKNDVPRMSEIVGKGKGDAADELRVPDAKDVDPKLAAAVFDMPAGRLCAGEPEALPTRFKADVKFRERRLARWSDLYTEYTPKLTLQLVKLGSDTVLGEIKFAETLRMITIGNEPKRLIVGAFAGAGSSAGHDHGAVSSTPLQPTGHFIMYYNVLETVPADKPIPIPAQLDGSGCPPNNYP